MKTSYAAFIEANPNCSKYESDPVAQSIFEMLSQDEAIIAMAAAADQNKPALHTGKDIPAPLLGRSRDSAASAANSRHSPRQQTRRQRGGSSPSPRRSRGPAQSVRSHPASPKAAALARHTRPLRLPGQPA